MYMYMYVYICILYMYACMFIYMCICICRWDPSRIWSSWMRAQEGSRWQKVFQASIVTLCRVKILTYGNFVCRVNIPEH
jgi:hypothetical protein